MNEENFSKWERVLIRTAALILLGIALARIIAGDLGVQFPH